MSVVFSPAHVPAHLLHTAAREEAASSEEALHREGDAHQRPAVRPSVQTELQILSGSIKNLRMQILFNKKNVNTTNLSKHKHVGCISIPQVSDMDFLTFFQSVFFCDRELSIPL